jgi:hypothetical protein
MGVSWRYSHRRHLVRASPSDSLYTAPFTDIMWGLTILLLPAVLFFCRAVPWSYYHSLFHPLLIMMWLQILNYASAANIVKFVLFFNGNFVLQIRLMWHNLVFPVIKESFYLSIPKTRAHAFFNLIHCPVICTSIHLSLFFMPEFFHVLFTCSMLKTLEKYKKCSYAGPETALQNRENEVKCSFRSGI